MRSFWYNNIRKVKALVWLFIHLDPFLMLGILFKIITGKKEDIQVSFRFKGKNIKFLMATEQTDLALLTEIFGFEAYQIKRNIQPKLIVDAGANKGASAIYWSKMYPEAKIHLYEPNPALIPLLRKNCELNDVNAKIFNCAISDKDGQINLSVSENHQFSTLTDNSEGIPVESKTIASLYKDTNISILKLDVEGAEEKIIPTLKVLSIDIIIQEIHYDRVDSAKILSMLESFGYISEVPYPQYKYLNPEVLHPIQIHFHKSFRTGGVKQ
jgi:FkbM family methyltransferase